MLRFVNNRENILKRIIKRQFMLFEHEDRGYKGAYLGKLKNKLSSYIDQHHSLPDQGSEVNMLNTNEHWEYSKAFLLEQLYENLAALNSVARTKELLINKRLEELSNSTAIIDPDKFPIFSLIEKIDEKDLVSLWSFKPKFKEDAAKKIGFSLEVKKSNIEHHESGDGVFLKCYNEMGFIPAGTFLGMVPGVIYSSYEAIPHADERIERQFIKCYDETYIDFIGEIPYPFQLGYSLKDYLNMNDYCNGVTGKIHDLTQIPGDFINPYALGHKINHPPPETSCNVVLLDMIIPNNFFPDQFMKFLPYVKATSDKDAGYLKEYYHNNCYHGMAIIALENIRDGEELYTSYFDNPRYSMEFTPDWLIKPPPFSPFLSKYEYDSKIGFFTRIVDMILFNRNADTYHKFIDKISYEPSKQPNQSLIQERINQKLKDKQSNR